MFGKFGFVYIWYDRKHKRYYIGSHWGTLDDGYICSSSWMKQAYKHRPQDFKRRILTLVYTNRIDLLEAEQKWISLIKPEETKKGSKKPRYYNLNLKVKDGWWLDPNKGKSVREKISIATKEAMWKPNTREKYLKGLETRDMSACSSKEVAKKKSISMKRTLSLVSKEEKSARAFRCVAVKKAKGVDFGKGSKTRIECEDCGRNYNPGNFTQHECVSGFNPGWRKCSCRFCRKEMNIGNFGRHKCLEIQKLDPAYVPKKCANCSKEILRDKFCSHSCSASFNGRLLGKDKGQKMKTKMKELWAKRKAGLLPFPQHKKDKVA